MELQSQLSTEETGGGSISEVGSDILLADPDDDYTPLDPAYLPPGLEDEGKCVKVMAKIYHHLFLSFVLKYEFICQALHMNTNNKIWVCHITVYDVC